MAKIDQFRAQLQGGGARPTHFRVRLAFPNGIAITGSNDASNRAIFMARGASLPASRITPIEVFYRGRPTKVAGERVFDDWTITVYNDNDFSIKNALEQWSTGIQNHASTNGLLTSGLYQTDLYVDQLDRNDVTLKTYRFHNAWPINVSEIQLDFQQNNQIEEFQVQFALDYWTSAEGEALSGPTTDAA